MNGYPGNHRIPPSGNRMMYHLPLDLSYNNNHPAHRSIPDVHYHDIFFNNYPPAPLTYYDMDAGQINNRNVVVPPAAHLPAHFGHPAINTSRLNTPQQPLPTVRSIRPALAPHSSSISMNFLPALPTKADKVAVPPPSAARTSQALGSSVTVTNKAPVLPLEDINVESLINDIVMASSNTAEATSSSTESLQESSQKATSLPRRNRRIVERYQVIHDYKGKKRSALDYQPEPLKSKKKSQKITADSLTPPQPSAKKSLQTSFKTVMIPDSTTESPTLTPSIESPSELFSDSDHSEEKNMPKQSHQNKSSNLPSIEDEIVIIKQTEPQQKSRSSTASSKSETSNLQMDNHASDDVIEKKATKSCSVTLEINKKSSSGKKNLQHNVSEKETCNKSANSSFSTENDDESPSENQPLLNRREKRKIYQTNFYQVVYPQPKRKKEESVDRKKTKQSTKGNSTASQNKRGKGRDNLLKDIPSINSRDEKEASQAAESSQIAPSVDTEESKLKATNQESKSKKQLDSKDAQEKASEKAESEEPELEESGSKGRIVWGKLTARCKPWPGVTIRGSDAAQVAASSENQWIFWYGEHKVSEVQLSRLQSFDSGFSKSFKLGSGNTYTKAVVEALSDCWELLAETQATKNQKLPEDIDQFLDWARQHFTDEKSILPEGRVSKFVSAKLAYIVETINNAEESTDFEEDDDDEDFQKKKQPSKSKKVVHQPKQPSRDKAAAKVRAQDLEIEDICLACGFEKTPESNIRPHPLFIGGLCDECLEVIRSTAFSYGADGCMSYCAICGGGGSLLVCDKENCGRTYCTDCLVELGSDDVVTAVEECDPWSCFLCEPATFPDLLIKRRQDSQQRLLEIFQKPSILHNVPKITEGSKLRVLSLFDGIGTAKVVLENLNLDIEAYYSVEIEDDAIQVVRRHHGDVHQLGDIRSLTEEKLAELGRIDLLVGGSPCNDLACVNPARKGLYDATGTGILFFDFYRILMTLMSIQPGHSVFWLFENVVHMNKETKATISRFLECEPVKLDAGYFSAQSRNRYFWGNIPGMYEPVAEDIKALRITLQDVLSEGREAVVPKIRTVTTRGASLLQGRNEDTHAVVMNGQSDKLWPTELEKVFGFPEHYTDVGNLAPGKRQKLLGRSWCVPVVEHLLKPLTKLFVMKPLPKIQCSCHKNNIQ